MRVLAVPFVLAIAACTFGLGEYPTGAAGGNNGGPPGEEPGEEGDAATTTTNTKEDASTSAEGGPCIHNTTGACTEPDADAGTCHGSQRCVQGVWGACSVSRKCPATWNVSTAGECKNVDVKGNSTKWTESPMVPQPVVLWSLSRTTPFDLLGQSDAFCFVPKDAGNCLTTTTTAVLVECTGNNKKLSGNDFVNGSIHGAEICVNNAGASCQVVDRHDARWTPNGATVPCERWFENAHWRVVAAPRCSW